MTAQVASDRVAFASERRKRYFAFHSSSLKPPPDLWSTLLVSGSVLNVHLANMRVQFRTVELDALLRTVRGHTLKAKRDPLSGAVTLPVPWAG